MLFIFVKTGRDIYNYLWISIFSIIGNQLYNFIDIYLQLDTRNPEIFIRKHIKPLLLIFGATIASSIYTLWDTIILYFLTTPEIVGYYTVSTKLTKLIIPVITAIGATLIPTITYFYNNNQIEIAKTYIRTSLDITIFTTIPITVGLMMLAPELIFTFAGNAFSPSIVTMQIMSVMPIIIGLGHLMSFQLLIPFGENRAVLVAMLIGLAVSIITNFILIPLFLDKGAALSAVITEGMVCVAYYKYIKNENKFELNNRLLFQTILSTITFIPIILIIRHISNNHLIVCILSIFTCVGAYSFIQFLIFKNYEMFKALIIKRTNQ
jgi:O-antigen/teichoic acid export membrane protein